MSGILWKETSPSGSDKQYISAVAINDEELPLFGTSGLFDASVYRENHPLTSMSLSGSVSNATIADCDILFSHEKPESVAGGAVLRARMNLSNRSSEPISLVVAFCTGLRPSRSISLEQVYLPLTALGTCRHSALHQLGENHQVESLRRSPLQWEPLTAHYLEPLGSEPDVLQTKCPLLIPLATTLNPQSPCAISLFGTPELPWAINMSSTERGQFLWKIQTRVLLAAGETREIEGFLSLHEKQPEAAWPIFHKCTCHEEKHPPEWLSKTQVHYFDFLSASKSNGPRGFGYVDDSASFRDFNVGLATQHGYYPFWGDYINPNRSSWHAMPADIHGGCQMSIDELRSRIKMTQQQGSRAAIYIHLVGFDDASPLWSQLQSACRIEADGGTPPFYWKGPDVIGVSRFMSIANPLWRNHLLEQARWIFEILNPDAIVVDESFGGIGYDYSSGSPSPSSPHAISFFKSLHQIARSFGPDKAILTSDCGLSSFVLWADGEAGDHCYKELLGHPEYRKKPVRYLSALNNKPWIPCSWHWQEFWEYQLELARDSGAGVGVSNGWQDYAGLSHINQTARDRYSRDIKNIYPAS